MYTKEELITKTVVQLKQYLAKNRNDDENFSHALNELLNREQNPTVFSANMPLEEVGQVIRAKIYEVQQSE